MKVFVQLVQVDLQTGNEHDIEKAHFRQSLDEFLLRKDPQNMGAEENTGSDESDDRRDPGLQSKPGSHKGQSHDNGKEEDRIMDFQREGQHKSIIKDA